MTELAQINEHSTEIANLENQTENIQSSTQDGRLGIVGALVSQFLDSSVFSF